MYFAKLNPCSCSDKDSFLKNEENPLKKLVVDKMENVVQLSVPLVVDYGIGNNWYEAH